MISKPDATELRFMSDMWGVAEDQVFLEGEDELAEYVMADTGLIWRGSYNRLRPCVWKYAQFEQDILDCALYLVAKVGGVRVVDRGDPVKIARAISAAVSSSFYDTVLSDLVIRNLSREIVA